MCSFSLALFFIIGMERIAWLDFLQVIRFPSLVNHLLVCTSTVHLEILKFFPPPRMRMVCVSLKGANISAT